MTRLHTLLFAVFFSILGSIASASDRWETLRAINLVENPTNQTGYGSRGELGPYQFRSSTWHNYTRRSFQLANDRAAADEVAVQHYEWIKGRLAAAGIDPSSFNIALAWNCGLSAVISGRIPMQSYGYAERVTNLAENFRRNEDQGQIAVVVTAKASSPMGAAATISSRPRCGRCWPHTAHGPSRRASRLHRE